MRKRLVQIIASVVVLAMWLRHPQIVDRSMCSALVAGGAIQVVSDIHSRLVSRIVTYTLGIFAGAVIVFSGQLSLARPLSALFVGVIFWIVHMMRKSALGFGDVLLAPVISLYVGWFDQLLIPVWLLLASAGAAVVALLTRQRTVAFVPWMVGAAAMTILLVPGSI